MNANALQQGPLTPAQAQEVADALKDNRSEEGLVEERRADGTVVVNLEGRFQNVTMAKKNDDGSITTACVDTPEAAVGFLQRREQTPATTPGTMPNRKAALKE